MICLRNERANMTPLDTRADYSWPFTDPSLLELHEQAQGKVGWIGKEARNLLLLF